MRYFSQINLLQRNHFLVIFTLLTYKIVLRLHFVFYIKLQCLVHELYLKQKLKLILKYLKNIFKAIFKCLHYYLSREHLSNNYSIYFQLFRILILQNLIYLKFLNQYFHNYKIYSLVLSKHNCEANILMVKTNSSKINMQSVRFLK